MFRLLDLSTSTLELSFQLVGALSGRQSDDGLQGQQRCVGGNYFKEEWTNEPC